MQLAENFNRQLKQCTDRYDYHLDFLEMEGKKEFEKALHILNTLSPEEKEKFWSEHEKNRDVKKFSQLKVDIDWEYSKRMRKRRKYNVRRMKEKEQKKREKEFQQPVNKANSYMSSAAIWNQKLVQAESDKVGTYQRLAEEHFKEALKIIETMTPEEKEEFWKLQERNRGVTEFSELITRKEYDELQK